MLTGVLSGKVSIVFPKSISPPNFTVPPLSMALCNSVALVGFVAADAVILLTGANPTIITKAKNILKNLFELNILVFIKVIFFRLVIQNRQIHQMRN